MNNINDWKFANILEQFKSREIDKLVSEVKKAEDIMNDPNYQWKDEKQKQMGLSDFL